jgi:hypothetical protein
MAVMLVGFINHGQRFRLECHAQFAFDLVCDFAHIPAGSNFQQQFAPA